MLMMLFPRNFPETNLPSKQAYHNGMNFFSAENDEPKKKRKRRKKHGSKSSFDADTSILQKAEKLLKNTENVLGEVLSQSGW